MTQQVLQAEAIATREASDDIHEEVPVVRDDEPEGLVPDLDLTRHADYRWPPGCKIV